MKKKILAALIGAISLFIPFAVALALIYSSTITVTNTGSEISMFPFLFSWNTTGYITGHYINSYGTDVQVKSGSTALPRMLADNKLLFASQVPAGSSSYDLTTGNSPSAFDVITGYNGYVTTNTSASLILGANFTIEQGIYVPSGNSTPLNHPNSLVTTANAGNVTSTLTYESFGSTSLTTHTIWNGAPYTPAYPDSQSRQVVKDINGRYWVVSMYWPPASSWPQSELFVHYSDDNGATWTESLHISDADPNKGYASASLLTDANGYVLLTYAKIVGPVPATVYYKTYTYTGVWGTETDMTDSVPFDGHLAALYMAPGIRTALTSTGEVYTIYTAFDNTTSTYNIRMSHMGTLIAGVWDLQEWVTSVGGGYMFDQGAPAIAIGPTKIHVAWSGLNGSIPILYYRDKVIGGFWGSIENPNSASAQEPSIICDSSDNVYVAATISFPFTEILIFKRISTGWVSSPPDWPSVFAFMEHPSISTDTNGSFFLTSYSTITGDTGYFASIGNDVNWVSNIDFSSSGNALQASSMWQYYPIISSTHLDIPKYGFVTTWADWTDGIADSLQRFTIFTAPVTGGTISVTGLGYSDQYVVAKTVKDATTLKLYVNNILKDTKSAAVTANNSGTDFTFMVGTPYMAYCTISINGVQVVRYEPVSYIIGDNLPDRSGQANHGTITWGANLGSISGNISGFTPLSSAVSIGNRPDIIPNQPVDYNDKGQAPAQKTTAPNITGMSDVMHIWSVLWAFNTDSVAWVFLAVILTLFVFWLFAWKLEHVGWAMFVASIVIGFFSSPGINVLPLGGLVFAVLGLVSGVVVEQRA